MIHTLVQKIANLEARLGISEAAVVSCAQQEQQIAGLQQQIAGMVQQIAGLHEAARSSAADHEAEVGFNFSFKKFGICCYNIFFESQLGDAQFCGRINKESHWE